MSETLDANVGAVKRPGFLTVLCILTFIGSGLGLLGGILGLVGSSVLSMFAPQGTIIVQIMTVLASALCLFGAIKMWGLAKQGYMLYVLGAVLSVVGSIVSAVTVASYVEQTMSTINSLEGMDSGFTATLNDSAVAMASAAAWTAVVVSVIINLLFVILYSVNRKHLVK